VEQELIPQPLSFSILIVDDDSNIRKTLSYCLSSVGHDVIAVGSKADAVEEGRDRSFDIAFVDLKLGEDNGLDLIPELLVDSPWIKIVVITGHASIQTAVEAIKRGAVDYIEKPFSPEQVKLITRRFGEISRLENELALLKENIEPFKPEEQIQSKNPEMQRVIETAKKAAESEAIILLRGESGTGKSILATAIHRWSKRGAKPLGIVSCPSIPAELLESELFGHVKGAFTGAVKDNPGRIAACDGGTIFLDEIGDLAFNLQAKLLRFIQDKQYERLGEGKTRNADVRIIAATNADLEKRVAEGRFREDLYYRLNVISLTMLPLRERPQDILPLAHGFLTFLCRSNHKKIIGIEPEAETALVNHTWPGNIRELRNTIERAVILGKGETITRGDLPVNLASGTAAIRIGDPVYLREIEEMHIRRILAKTSSLKEASAILGIDQATLWRKRKLYGI